MERKCQVVITTSRHPSKKTLELINDLVNSFPNTCKIVRGKKSFITVLEEAVRYEAEHIMFIWDRRGMPSAIVFYEVQKRRWKPYMIIISGIKTRRELPVYTTRRAPAKNAVIVDTAGGELGEILSEVFKYPLIYDLNHVKGTFDTIIHIRPREGYFVEILGRDFGPRASLLKIKKIVYRYV
ncbi:MAG: ribosomal biosynthesis protein [Pyrobaculum sp.]